MRGELYEYFGEMLSQADIAKKEGINRSTLSDWYKKTGNMIEAVEGAKKSLAQRNIEYNGEILSLKAISVKEDVKFESLKKNWEDTEYDIYKAVKLTKKSQLKRNGSIEYNGEMMTILAISNMEELEHHALGRYYEKTGNIYESVELAKKAKERHNGTIPYKGQMMTITGIANLEKIKRDTLKAYYELYGNIEKAVFITKESQAKRKQALLRGKKATYEELSNYLGISTFNLEKMINDGYSPDEIEKKIKKGVKKEEQLKFNEDSLYSYCIKNSYNYWVINYMIKTFNKTPEEAIRLYLENGQKVPTKWIYEKYNLLFKHLLLNYGLDSNRIIKIMKDNNCGIEKAIDELIFASDNDKNDLKIAEINWLKELYSFLKELSPEEFEEAKKTFYIDNRELNFMQEKGNKIELIKRQLLLFEFSNIINEWTLDELIEMMNLYEITDEEKRIIVIDLYSPFENKIINPTDEFNNRHNQLKNAIIDSSFTIDDVTEEEKKIIEIKRNILTNIINEQSKKIEGIPFK